MAALALKTVGASAQDVPNTKGWDAAQISLVSTLGIAFCVFCAVLLSSAFFLWRSRRRAKQMAADLDNAKVELGAQRNRAASLERKLSRQEAFVARNVWQGPEAYSAVPPEVLPRQHSDSRPVVAHDEDVFAVGNDDESTDGDSGNGDGESGWSTEAVSGGSPRSPTLMRALFVRRSAIKTVDVQPKGAGNQGVGLTAAALPARQAQEKVREAPSAELDRVEKVLPLDDQDLGVRSQQDDSQAQMNRYWQPERHYRAGAKAGPDELAAEVNPTTTEAGRDAKGGGKVSASIASSGGSSHQVGPDTPESSMSPSALTAPVSGGVSPPGFVAVSI